MKDKPILRHVLYALVFLGMTIISPLFFTMAYPIRDWVRAKKFPFLWWFLNSDEPTNTANDYGDRGWRLKNNIIVANLSKVGLYIVSFRWAVIRNGFYNFKLTKFIPKTGERYDYNIIKNTPEDVSPMMFRNEKIHGEAYVTFRVGGTKYFRYSLTTTDKKKIFPFGFQKSFPFVNSTPIRKHINLMFGVSAVRIIYKIRMWDELDYSGQNK